MVEPIDTRLIYEILKDVQGRLAALEGMRGEMREGFASLRAHMATQHGDAVFLERRVVDLEKDMERIKRPPAACRPGRRCMTPAVARHLTRRRLA